MTLRVRETMEARNIVPVIPMGKSRKLRVEVDRKLLEHVAEVARIGLTEDEIKKFLFKYDVFPIALRKGKLIDRGSLLTL